MSSIAPELQQPQGEGIIDTSPFGFSPRLRKVLIRLLSAAIIAVGLIPLAHMIFLIFSVGSNVMSNDYIGWVRVADRVLFGTYDWLRFPHDSFMASHCYMLPFLLELGMMAGGVWSANNACLLGVVIILATTYLEWLSLSESLGLCRSLLLAILLAINFGTTQCSTIMFGTWSIAVAGLAQFGFALGVWALVKLRQSKPTLAIAVAGVGAVISSFSWGVAIPVWCGLLFLQGISRSRRWQEWLITASFMAASFAPYIAIMLAAKDALKAVGCSQSGFNLSTIINLLGRSMGNNIATVDGGIATCEWSVVACTLLLCVTFYAFVCARKMPAVVHPAIAYILHALASALLIAAVREHISVWYATQTKSFFIGFVAIAVATLSNSTDRPLSVYRWLFAATGAVSLLTWFGFYLTSNWTYADKHFYLAARAPSSESYERNYLTAPTYGEFLLFQWAPGNQRYTKRLGSILSRHALGCFGPQQQWTLQGDYLMRNVSYDRDLACPTPTWINGFNAYNSRPWFDYHRLNLSLVAPQRVTWEIVLPTSAQHVIFRTVCRAPQLGGQHRSAAAKVTVSWDGHAISELSFADLAIDPDKGHPVDLELSKYAGKKLTVSLEASAPLGIHDAFTVFEYPRLTFGQQPEHPTQIDTEAMKPENTDLSPHFPTADDALTLTTAAAEKLSLKLPDVPARTFRYLYLKARSEGVSSKQVLSLSFVQASGVALSWKLPLLDDQLQHAYTFDLRLLELPAYAKLQSLDISTFQNEKDMDRRTLISDVKLLR